MLVKNISVNNFISLLNYAFETCNYVSLFEHYYYDRCGEDIRNLILEEENLSRKEFFQKYALDDISNICKLYEDNKKIQFLVKPFYEQISFKQFSIEKITNMYIKRAIENYFYKYNIRNFLDEHFHCIKCVKNIYPELTKGIEPYGIIYYLSIDNKIKSSLLDKKNIWGWEYPYCLEDLCFLRNNQYWLKSVAHEKICNIYCESEEEYEYLKAIGIEFYDDKYVPISEIEKKELMVAGLN